VGRKYYLQYTELKCENPNSWQTGGAAIPLPLMVKQNGVSEESHKLSPDTVISLWRHKQSVALTPYWQGSETLWFTASTPSFIRGWITF